MKKRGVTLIELVISMAIATILIGSIASAFFPVISIYNSQNKQSTVKDIANQIIFVLKEEIRDAKEILIKNSNDGEYVCYYTNGGKIKTNNIAKSKINSMPNALLEDKYKVKLSFTNTTDKVIDITIKIKDTSTGNNIYFTGYASPINNKATLTINGSNRLCIKKPGD